ncbi:MAG: glycosyltransferase, exosortase A system-associated [Candidatus Nealsonbacteria bacterium]|nr:glycosyltransferase, exosortase A system-associated [Candidatus Nealsonbacteria bacterium]
MKILHVLNHSVPHLDGYCVRGASIVRFQREIGLEPVVVTSLHQEPVPTEPMETIDDVRYYRTLPHNETQLPVLHELAAIRRLRRRILEVADRERPDVIHAHSPCLWGHAAAAAARRLRLPLVYEIRGIWEDAAVDLGRLRETALKYRISRMLETRVARRADVVVAIADRLIAEFAGRGVDRRKMFLVPNGVSVKDFEDVEPASNAQLKEKLGINGCVAVGYIGSLYPWEGVDDLIRAVPEILRRQPNTKFVIVGRGEQEQLLRKLTDELSLESHVCLVGGVPHDEVADYYGILDVLVYPRRSSRNTELVTPLKPLEAMAMGKALLASDVGGLRELLADGAGLLHRPGDCDDLAEKCALMIGAPEKRKTLGDEARRAVLAKRDWRDVVRGYLKVYDFVLSGNDTPADATTDGQTT